MKREQGARLYPDAMAGRRMAEDVADWYMKHRDTFISGEYRYGD